MSYSNFFYGKKILITGGAGYKGVLLTDALLKLNHEVTILDNFMYGYESILHLISNENLTINKKILNQNRI